LSKDFLSNCSDLFLKVKQNYTLKRHFYLFSSWTILKFNFEGSTSRNHLIKIYEKSHRAVPFSVASISAMLHTARLKIFKRLARYARPASLSARGFVSGNGYARYARCSVAYVNRNKQLRARLETRGGCILPSACICRWAGRICLFSGIFKN